MCLFTAASMLFAVSLIFFQNRQDQIIKNRDMNFNDSISLNGGNHNNMKFLFHHLLEKQRNGESTIGPIVTKPPVKPSPPGNSEH